MKYTDKLTMQEIIPNGVYTSVRFKKHNEDKLIDCVVFRNSWKENLSGKILCNIYEYLHISYIHNGCMNSCDFDDIEYLEIGVEDDPYLEIIQDIHSLNYEEFYIDVCNRMCPIIVTSDNVLFGNNTTTGDSPIDTHAKLYNKFELGELTSDCLFNRSSIGAHDDKYLMGHITNNGHIVIERFGTGFEDTIKFAKEVFSKTNIIKEFYVFDDLDCMKIILK